MKLLLLLPFLLFAVQTYSRSVLIPADTYPLKHGLATRATVTAWDESLSTGRKIWDNLKGKLDTDSPTDKSDGGEGFCAYEYKEMELLMTPPDEVLSMLQNDMGKDPTDEFHKMDITDGKSRCLMYLDQDGTVMANEAMEYGDGAHLRTSEAMYQLYNSVFEFNDTQRKLRYLYVWKIVNKKSNEVMRKAVDGNEDEWQSFTPDSDAFLALLGCPVGRWTGWMLIEHAKALGKKTIEKIDVRPGDGRMRFVLSV